MARVELTDDAKDDLRGLDNSVRTRVLKDLKKLGQSPHLRGEPLGSHQGGDLSRLRKLRVGPKKAYRAVFAAAGDEVAVVMVVGAGDLGNPDAVGALVEAAFAVGAAATVAWSTCHQTLPRPAYSVTYSMGGLCRGYAEV